MTKIFAAVLTCLAITGLSPQTRAQLPDWCPSDTVVANCDGCVAQAFVNQAVVSAQFLVTRGEVPLEPECTDCNFEISFVITFDAAHVGSIDPTTVGAKAGAYSGSDFVPGRFGEGGMIDANNQLTAEWSFSLSCNEPGEQNPGPDSECLSGYFQYGIGSTLYTLNYCLVALCYKCRDA